MFFPDRERDLLRARSVRQGARGGLRRNLQSEERLLQASTADNHVPERVTKRIHGYIEVLPQAAKDSLLQSGCSFVRGDGMQQEKAQV